MKKIKELFSKLFETNNDEYFAMQNTFANINMLH